MHAPLCLPTPDGEFIASFSETGLARLEFPAHPGSRPRPHPTSPAPAPDPRWAALTARALDAARTGQPIAELPPLDLRAGTRFQQLVWRTLQQIPVGQTRTYGQLARAIRRPTAFRAVGQACGANPIPLLIPCHRAVAAGGALGGFSAGLPWKRLLLDREAG